jgi:hypothetical protein
MQIAAGSRAEKRRRQMLENIGKMKPQGDDL